MEKEKSYDAFRGFLYRVNCYDGMLLKYSYSKYICHIQLFIYSITSCGVGSQFFIVRLKVAGFVLIIKIIVWRTFQPHYVAESFVSFVENWRE